MLFYFAFEGLDAHNAHIMESLKVDAELSVILSDLSVCPLSALPTDRVPKSSHR